MDLLKKYFPFSFKATDVTGLVVALIVYVVVCGIGGAIIGWLSGIAIIGILFSALGVLLDLYGLIGIVLSILVFVKVIS